MNLPAVQMKSSLMAGMAAKYNVPEKEMLATLKATAFKGNVSDAQMTALLIVASQFNLNPWTKEIYAFPDKNNGIVPIVGVDGWARIINENPMFDGVDFVQDSESCTCKIYRKDRSHPISVTEFLSECKRDTGPWKSHPKRMLRHKALVQCARVAFAYTGIYDEDEAERIVEKEINPSQQGLPHEDVSAMLEKINGADSMVSLAEVWLGYKEFKTQDAREILTAAKDARKIELQNPPVVDTFLAEMEEASNGTA